MKKGIFVGTFNEEDIKRGADQKAIKEAMEKTGKKYINTELVKKAKEIVGIKIWVCDFEDCTDFI